MAQTSNNYWLFQANPAELNLAQVLQQEDLQTFPVQQHARRIRPGDGIILWQTGRKAACYGLAEVEAGPDAHPLSGSESGYWTIEFPAEQIRVSLRIIVNLHDRPLRWEALRGLPAFQKFNGGRAGRNFRATAEQYRAILQLTAVQDAFEETQADYGGGPWLAPPLNRILYGPPGTGKTYQTVVHALSVVENRSLEELQLEDRASLRRRYDHYMSTGQIAFVTFHQSFTYEDFIEGIKPVSKEGQVHYEIQNGLFMLMAQAARGALLQATVAPETAAQPRQTEFNPLYGAFLRYLETDHFHYFESPDKYRYFLHRILRFGNLDLRPEKSFSTLTVQKSTLHQLYNYFTEVGDLSSEQQIAPLIGSGDSRAYLTVFRELKKFEHFFREQQADELVEEDSDQLVELPPVSDQTIQCCRRYVLIIDEINRGNLASIFGELITLLEADKREGRPEALSTILPYSKRFFSIPANLYLVATMNTADRSTEPMDTALRRRFRFIEVSPRPELIDEIGRTPQPGGVKLSSLLRAINARLSLLIDEDHQLGHSYFLDLENLDDLRRIFEHQIIPLLRDFFYDDVRKVGLVLGGAFLRPRAETGLLADFDYPLPNEYREGVAYGLRPMEELTEADFIQIYEKA